MKSFLFIFTVFILMTSPVLSFNKKNIQVEDSSLTRNAHKYAVLQTLGVDFGIWAWNRYVAQRSWAKINWNTIRGNFEKGWVLDDNTFHVNQFGHPFQGALVFTAARAQGLTFWQSVYYPVFSSYIWEMALETERPSINDMFTTPLSGITYGEILHRMSILALGDNPGVKQELLAFIINPSLGINRLFRGHPRPSFGRDRVKTYRAGISLGGGGYFLDNQDEMLPNQFLRFHLFYGNPFNSRSIKNPFDYFSFIGVLNFDRTDLVGEIYSNGLLKKIKIKRGKTYSYSVGIYKNYDFMNHDKFKVSSSSIGMGLIQNFELADGLDLYNEIFLNTIIFGSSGGDSVDVSEREYYYGPGLSAKLIFILKYKNNVNVYTRLKRYLVYNVEDLRLTRYENINLLKIGVQVHVWNPVSIGGEYTLASRRPIGSSVPQALQKQDIFRFYIIYHLGNLNLL